MIERRHGSLTLELIATLQARGARQTRMFVLGDAQHLLGDADRPARTGTAPV
jgi:hypothetical protein